MLAWNAEGAEGLTNPSFPRTSMTDQSQRSMKMLQLSSGATDVFRPAGLIRACRLLVCRRYIR